MEKNPNNSQQDGANCNAKISTGFYAFLAIVAIAAVIWLILK
ncbi:hypothetical protein [Parapedobacter sp. DT-150]